jgi:hypothetical protein
VWGIWGELVSGAIWLCGGGDIRVYLEVRIGIGNCFGEPWFLCYWIDLGSVTETAR